MKLSSLISLGLLIISASAMADINYTNIVQTSCRAASDSHSFSVEILSSQPSHNSCKFTVANIDGTKIDTVNESRSLPTYLLNLTDRSLVTVEAAASTLLSFDIEKIKSKIENSNVVSCSSLYEEINEFKLLKCDINGSAEYFVSTPDSKTVMPATCEEKIEKLQDMKILRRTWIEFNINSTREGAIKSGHSYGGECG